MDDKKQEPKGVSPDRSAGGFDSPEVRIVEADDYVKAHYDELTWNITVEEAADLALAELTSNLRKHNSNKGRNR